MKSLKQLREDDAIEVLRKHPDGMRPSDFGWALWGESTQYPDRGIGSHAQNKFCRSAGKLLRRLERQKRATTVYGTRGYTLWIATGGSA